MVGIEELEQLLTARRPVVKGGYNQHGLTGISRQYQWADQHYNSGRPQTPRERLHAIELRIRACNEQLAHKKSLGYDTVSTEAILGKLIKERTKLEYSI